MTKEITRKLNSIIKINKLTKELEFQAPKTKKNVKTTKNGAPSASPPPPPVSLRKNGIYNPKLGFEGCWTHVKHVGIKFTNQYPKYTATHKI
jgi:hypothetical protein